MDSNTLAHPAPRILVYGIEKAGLEVPSQEIATDRYRMVFEPFESPVRFNDFDSVILFQGIFESFERVRDGYSGSRVRGQYRQTELTRRSNELDLLLRQGGFACILLCRTFLDYADGDSFKHTDLAKRILNIRGIYRNNYSIPANAIHSTRNEFLRFLQLYGSASSYFQIHNDALDLRILAKVGSEIVGMILHRSVFFVPTLLPRADEQPIGEYFRLLCEALLSSRKKLSVEIPQWANAFEFPDEHTLRQQRESLLAQANEVKSTIDELERFKGALVYDSELLVDSVAAILRQGFGFRIDTIDEYREDLKILDDDDSPVALVEVKGTNRGLKREHLNQADSHRERANLPSSFPTILIINPNIRNSSSIADKDRDLPPEQIEHAVRIGVLVLRTLDLLRLLGLTKTERYTAHQVLSVLTSHHGWLRAEEGSYQIVGEAGAEDEA
ncbi:MAG: hypothetical protein ACYTAN_16210 [Planctomycetota bacterium]|jgi:hypothetical protein